MRPLILLLLAACSASSNPFTAQATNSGPPYERASLDLVPVPLFVNTTAADGRGAFYLDAGTRIAWSEDFAGASRREAGRLERYLEAGTGWDLAADMGPPAERTVHLAIDPNLAAQLEARSPGCVGDEAYRIEVKAERILLRGASGRGLGHAVATLQQMLSPELAEAEAWEHFPGTYFPFEQVVIEDAPRFRWRGMHLDVGRYLYDVEDVLGFLDLMAFYKFNVFHWHLTEDQGWRIEIEAFPRLTEVGAFRKSTPVRGDRGSDDGVPYGGFYTQDEVRRVVAHAAELGIDVMPEIELPGHSTAAIVAYPELGNPEFTDGLEVGFRWGVHRNTLHPSEYTLDFYETVFDEVLALFPFEFVHIGGDEAPKTQWENSPTTQARMAELGLEDEHALQAWFVGHFDDYLSERGRRLVGWDEIAEGGLAPGATMMVWRGWHRGVEAARLGHDIIMAPTSHTYFDYYQADPAGEPEAIFGFLPLEKVYGFEPVPPELSAEERGRVLGAQAQLWSEYLHEWTKVEYMALPRMLALAEVVWAPEQAKDYADFQRRLLWQFDHLDARGLNYRVPEPEFAADLVVFEGSHELPLPGVLGRAALEPDERHRMWFLLDDDGDGVVDVDDQRWHRPLEVDDTRTVTTALKRDHLGDHERVGASAAVELVRADLAGTTPDELEPGLWLEAFSHPGGIPADLPDLTGAPGAGWEVLQAATPVEAIAPLAGMDRVAARFHGWLQVDEPGLWRFELGSDDGSRLLICGRTFLDNGGQHGHIVKDGTAQLPAGTWPFEVHWFDAGGAESLELSIDGPGTWRFLRRP